MLLLDNTTLIVRPAKLLMARSGCIIHQAECTSDRIGKLSASCLKQTTKNFCQTYTSRHTPNVPGPCCSAGSARGGGRRPAVHTQRQKLARPCCLSKQQTSPQPACQNAAPEGKVRSSAYCRVFFGLCISGLQAPLCVPREWALNRYEGVHAYIHAYF